MDKGNLISVLGAGLLAATLYIGTSDYAKTNPQLVFFSGVASSFLVGLGFKKPGSES